MGSSFLILSDLFDFSRITNALMFAVPALICITFHELAHGFSAYRLGDNTAKEMGRLTLNPIKHIDIVGLLMMMFVGFGWAKPVPVNMYNFKHPKWYMALTAFAGPLSNIILTTVVLFLFGFFAAAIARLDAGRVIIDLIYHTAYLSVALAVFNLMPIPPLDGSKVLFSLIPEGLYVKLMRYERYGMILLIIILFVPFFRNIVGTITETIFNSLTVVFEISYDLVN